MSSIQGRHAGRGRVESRVTQLFPGLSDSREEAKEPLRPAQSRPQAGCSRVSAPMGKSPSRQGRTQEGVCDTQQRKSNTIPFSWVSLGKHILERIVCESPGLGLPGCVPREAQPPPLGLMAPEDPPLCCSLFLSVEGHALGKPSRSPEDLSAQEMPRGEQRTGGTTTSQR